MNISENSTKPIYLQIAEILEDLILKDNLKEHEQAYSTNQLAKIYNINPATARKGINLLIEEGILYKKRGVGMFVSENAKEYIQKKRKESFFNDFILEMLQEAIKLQLSKEEIIHMIENSDM